MPRLLTRPIHPYSLTTLLLPHPLFHVPSSPTQYHTTPNMASSRSSESTQLETGQGGPKAEVATTTPSIHSNLTGKIEEQGASSSHQKKEASSIDIERQEPMKEPAISKKAAILLFVGYVTTTLLLFLIPILLCWRLIVRLYRSPRSTRPLPSLPFPSSPFPSFLTLILDLHTLL